MRKLLVVLIIFAGILTAFYTFAAVITSYTPTNIFTVGVGADSGANQYDGFIFTIPYRSVVGSMTLKTPTAQTNVLPHNVDFVLMDFFGNVIASKNDTTTTTASNTEFTIEFSSPIEVAAGTYFFGQHRNSGTGMVLGYEVAGEYAFGCRYDNQVASANFSLSSCTSANDVYFKLNTSGTDSIQILYPDSGSSGIDNFGLWQISKTTAAAYNSGFVNIYVAATSTVSQSNYDWFDQVQSNFNLGTQTLLVPRLNGSYASGTTYYAAAYMYSGSTLLASSTISNFSIGDTDEEIVFTDFIDIIPSAGLDFSTSTADSSVCVRFPFSYFCDFVDLWSGFNATSTTDSLPVLSFEILLPDRTTSTIPIISASNINSTLGASNVALMRSLIQYGLWLAFGYYVYSRIKNHRL